MSNKSEHTEADRFRAFAKKVVNVPKAVIDRRETDYQKSRKALRKARA
jgi:hypothetical protein